MTSPILVTLTSRCDPHFKGSNISFNENKLDGVDLSSNGLDYSVQRREEELFGFRWIEFVNIA